MKIKLLAILGVGVLFCSSCTRDCVKCTVYDENENALGEYTSCSNNPEHEATENFCQSGCEGEYKAVCTERD